MANGLTELTDDPRISKGSKYRKTVYKYPRTVEGDQFGHASPELLIEVNSFTHPDPNERRGIQTLIAETLVAKDRAELISQFELEGFYVNVLSVRRTLVEKMLGVIKDSYNENPVGRLSNRIRHLYDICLILRHKEYKAFVQSAEFISLCKVCIADEEAVFIKSPNIFEKSLSDAPLFSEFSNWRPALEATYNNDFAQLVFGEMPEMDEIVNTIRFLKENLGK